MMFNEHSQLQESGQRRIKPGYEDFLAEYSTESDYTPIVSERLKSDPSYEELPPVDGVEMTSYAGRHIIGSDRPILGGIYVSSYGFDNKNFSEATVVDEKYGLLVPIYNEIQSRAEHRRANGRGFKSGLLSDVYETSKRVLRYDLPATDRIVEGLKARHPGTKAPKIALDYFISEGVGVCRHQALLGAYLIEKFCASGELRGAVSLDRNFFPGHGGHAWIRYKNFNGHIFILDPAQKFTGRLDQLQDDRHKGIFRWPYERDGDIYENA